MADDEDRSTNNKTLTITIAAMSAVAALLGSGLGVVGTYVATREQVSSQQFLQRREDLRVSCIGLQEATFRLELQLEQFRQLGGLPSEPTTSLYELVRNETNAYTKQYASLLLDASQPTTDAGNLVLMDIYEINISAARNDALVSTINSTRDESAPKLGLTPDGLAAVSNLLTKLRGHRGILVEQCRQDLNFSR